MIRVLLTAAICFLPVAASAEDTPDVATLIEARQASFNEMGEAMKVFRAALRGGDVPAEKLQAAAGVVFGYATDIAGWFPAGSGPESGVETDALPYIWKNTEKFSQVSADMLPAAEALVAAAQAGERDGLIQAVRGVGAACKACHDSYRAD